MNIYVKSAFVLCTTIIGSFLGWQKSNSEVGTLQYETVLFGTVLSSDELSSVEEKETSSHFFAEAILGWTLSPAFKENLNFPLSSRKQERGNIIFEFTSDSEEKSLEKTQKFRKILETKLQQYNTQANTKFNILMDKPITKEKSPHKSFWTMGGAIFGFFFGLLILELFLFIRRKK